MKESSVRDIIDAVEGQQILCFAGTVKQVFKVNKGDNSYGAYHTQYIIVAEGKDEVKVKLDGHDAWNPLEMKGRRVVFTATKPEDKWCGIMLKDETYKDKTERVVKVTRAADVQISGSGTKQEPPRQEPPRPHQQSSQAPGQQSRQQAPAAPDRPTERPAERPTAEVRPGPTEPDQMKAAKRLLGSMVNIEWEVTHAAQIVAQAYKDRYQEPMLESHFSGLVGRMFIGLEKNGINVGNVPSKLNEDLARAAHQLANPKTGN